MLDFRIGAGVWRPLAGLAAAAAVLLAGCSANQAPEEENIPRPGPKRQYDPRYDESIFGPGGAVLRTGARSTLRNILGGGGDEGEGALPINKYLWQAALDTVSFLPLESTDPFTGVIVTEWAARPEAPDERLKVTVRITGPELSAASLKVAVFREVRDEKGLWVPAPVSAETVEKLEDAILVRAREIRIAAREAGEAG